MDATETASESDIGARVIDEIVRAKLFDVSCPDAPGSSCLIIWSANAAEQLSELIRRSLSV